MADIQQQPSCDNLGRDARDPGVQPVPISRSTRPALIQLIQLVALSIATSSVFIVTVDFIVTAVNNSLTAARLLLACARERCTTTCALSVACVARAKTFVAFGSGVSCSFTILLAVSTVCLSVAASGSTPVSAEPLLDIISINGACQFALTGSSASAQPPGRPPGRPPGNRGTQPDGCFTTSRPSVVNSSVAGAEIAGRNSTSAANLELVGSKSGEDDVSDLAIDPYDPTPRPDTDGLNGTKEGGLPYETEPGILSRRAEALRERKRKAAAAAAAKAPLEAEKSVGAPTPSLSLPSSPAPPEPPGSAPRTAPPGSKHVAGSIVGATNRLDAIAKVEIEPPVEKPPSPRHESHSTTGSLSVLPESAVGHEANLATCDVDKVSVPHHPGRMASTTRMDENLSLTTKQNQRMSGKLPFAFFAVAVLAVTVALGVALTPSARTVSPASATGETGAGFAQIAQRPPANLGGVSPRFRADRDSSPQVIAPVIAEHRAFGAGPKYIGQFIALASLWFWIYPAHVTWIAIHRPIDCVRAAGLAIAAPFIAVAPVAAHRVIGVGQKNGFFVRAVGSLNSLRSMGGPIALLVLAVASAPVYSGSGATLNDPQTAAVGNAVKSTLKSARATARNSAAVGGSFIATPDSGATSHSTPNGGLLVNKRPFKELFADASGNISNVIAIGDMPVTATDSDGNRIHFTITNVRLSGLNFALDASYESNSSTQAGAWCVVRFSSRDHF